MPPDTGHTVVSMESTGGGESTSNSGTQDRLVTHDSDYESPDDDEKDDYETPSALLVRDANVKRNQSRRVDVGAATVAGSTGGYINDTVRRERIAASLHTWSCRA